MKTNNSSNNLRGLREIWSEIDSAKQMSFMGKVFHQAVSGLRMLKGARLIALAMINILLLFSALVAIVSSLAFSAPNQFSANLSLSQIEVFLDPLIEEKQFLALKLESIPGVVSVKYVSAQQRLESLTEQYNIKLAASSHLQKFNPIPPSAIIEIDPQADLKLISEKLSNTAGVDFVNSSSIANQVHGLQQSVLWISLISLTLILVAVSLSAYMFSRVVVLSQRNELLTMEVLGAYRWQRIAPILFQLAVLGVVAIGLGFFVAGVILAVLQQLILSQLEVELLLSWLVMPVLFVCLLLAICFGAIASFKTASLKEA